MPPKYTVVQTKIDSNEEWVKIAGDDAEMNFLHGSSRQNSGPASHPKLVACAWLARRPATQPPS